MGSSTASMATSWPQPDRVPPTSSVGVGVVVPGALTGDARLAGSHLPGLALRREQQGAAGAAGIVRRGGTYHRLPGRPAVVIERRNSSIATGCGSGSASPRPNPSASSTGSSMATHRQSASMGSSLETPYSLGRRRTSPSSPTVGTTSNGQGRTSLFVPPRGGEPPGPVWLVVRDPQHPLHRALLPAGRKGAEPEPATTTFPICAAHGAESFATTMETIEPGP
jgi:hypothetical protein